jgi:hypothetical protein
VIDEKEIVGVMKEFSDEILGAESERDLIVACYRVTDIAMARIERDLSRGNQISFTVMGDCASDTGSILTPVHENWVAFASAFRAAIEQATTTANKTIANMNVSCRIMIIAPCARAEPPGCFSCSPG